MSPLKDKRIELRLTARQKELVEQAASALGRTVTDFSTDVLTERAAEVMRRERQLRVDAEAFDAFNEILDAPAVSVDGLVGLFERRSVFSE